jgi:hypothetical protein
VVIDFLAARELYRSTTDDRSIENYADAQERLLAGGSSVHVSRARAVCLIEMSLEDVDCAVTAQFMRAVGFDALRSFGIPVNQDPIADEGTGMIDDDYIL